MEAEAPHQKAVCECKGLSQWHWLVTFSIVLDIVGYLATFLASLSYIASACNGINQKYLYIVLRVPCRWKQSHSFPRLPQTKPPEARGSRASHQAPVNQRLRSKVERKERKNSRDSRTEAQRRGTNLKPLPTISSSVGGVVYSNNVS